MVRRCSSSSPSPRLLTTWAAEIHQNAHRRFWIYAEQVDCFLQRPWQRGEFWLFFQDVNCCFAPTSFPMNFGKNYHFTCHAWMTMDEWKPADSFHWLRHFQSCGQCFHRFFVKRNCRVEKRDAPWYWFHTKKETNLGWNMIILKTKGAQDQWLRQFSSSICGEIISLWFMNCGTYFCSDPLFWKKNTCRWRIHLRAKNKLACEKQTELRTACKNIYFYLLTPNIEVSDQPFPWSGSPHEKNIAYKDCDPSKFAVPTAVVFFWLLAALPEAGSQPLLGDKLSEKHDVERLHLTWPRWNKAN